MELLIGITSKNRAKILPKAICSALRQTFAEKKIWVYDDASEDNTTDLLKTFNNVSWSIGETSKGLVWARNFFMQKEGYNYFCSLDDDAWFLENDAIEEAMLYLKSNPDVGALGFDMLSPDAPEKKTKNPYFCETNNFIGCGHIINLKAAKEIGYYTPNPGFYGAEEKDFCIRLIDLGYKIITYKGKYVWHDKTMISRNLSAQHRSGVCNDLVFTYRRAPFLTLIPLILIKIFKHAKFAVNHKPTSLISPFKDGFIDFIKWLLKGNTNRKAVSFKAFKRYTDLQKN
ncbi:glycosyltransferase family 2 protein [Pedobacter sp.]